MNEIGVVLTGGGPATRRRAPPWPDRPAPRQAPASPDSTDRFYAAVRLVVRFWLWFCFKPVDVRHPERVPVDGPVLLCINHPNNLIDSLVVAAVLRRKVHFLAAAAMFRTPLVARFLRACGAIPVCRKEDDADRMDPNAKAFAACFQALEAGVSSRSIPKARHMPRHASGASRAARLASRWATRRFDRASSRSSLWGSRSRRASHSSGGCSSPSESRSRWRRVSRPIGTTRARRSLL